MLDDHEFDMPLAQKPVLDAGGAPPHSEDIRPSQSHSADISGATNLSEPEPEQSWSQSPSQSQSQYQFLTPIQSQRLGSNPQRHHGPRMHSPTWIFLASDLLLHATG